MDPFHRFPGGVWAVDFEFTARPGECPVPICMVARDLISGRMVHLSMNELSTCISPPFKTDDTALVVAYYASAEMSCFLSLGWHMPVHVVDLFAEFRVLTNGRQITAGNGLLGALLYFGVTAISESEKDIMRVLAMRGGPFTDEEMRALLVYCQSDVDALARLWPRMTPNLNWGTALLRGRYAKAAARMEYAGVPIDVTMLDAMRRHWDDLRRHLVQRVDITYKTYDGMTFRKDRWLSWCAQNRVPWPKLPSGQADLKSDTFRDVAKIYPSVRSMYDLRVILGAMRKIGLEVGSDGRNRCLLSILRSKTSRNQPSNARFIFGPAAWMRSLIKPLPGWGIAYVDWSQQEFGIAAALSGDQAMCDAYISGDPYLSFAKMAKAVPPDATKGSHPQERDKFKICALAVQYGQGAESLGAGIGASTAEGAHLLSQHRRVFSHFWEWSERAINQARILGEIQSVFGWRLATHDQKWRTIANFPAQANGAEMLRLACFRTTEQGIRVCAPVHDALLIEAPLDQLDMAVTQTQAAMAWASRQVLGGFELRSDAKVVRYPDRYVDGRGADLWSTVVEYLRQAGEEV